MERREGPRLARLFKQQLTRHLASGHSLAMGDQILASGTNFLATVLIARFGGASALGSYVVAMTILAALLAFQDALIIKPYTIQQHGIEGSRENHAGMSLLFSLALSAACTIALGIFWICCGVAGWAASMASMVLVLACVVPFALAKEFARRYSFAQLALWNAITIDSAVATLQIGGLVGLGIAGQLSASTALASLSLSCGLTSVVWFTLRRGSFDMSCHKFRSTAWQSWTLGKWLLAGQITREVQQSAPYWLLSLVAGPAMTGIYAASMSVVSFANPLVFGLSNIITAKSSLAWKDGGGPALWARSIRDALLLGTVLSILCAVVFMAGDQIIAVLFPREVASGGATLTFLLALSIMAAATGMPASNALAVMQRPRAIVVVGIAGAVTTVSLTYLLLLEWGLIGAAWGFLLGNVLGLCGRWASLAVLIPGPRNRTSAIAAVRALGGFEATTHLAAEMLGEGDFAAVYRVARPAARPGSEIPDVIAVKMFKPEAGYDGEELNRQFIALNDMNCALDGVSADGWTARVPKPFRIIAEPAAIVMSLVPGKAFDAMASEGGLESDAQVAEVATATCSIMTHAWSVGKVHGDFGLRNLLFDREGRTIGQAAIQFALHEPAVAAVVPNIYDQAGLREFAASCEATPLSDADYARVQDLYATNFGLPAR